jgi:hypothetical protein
MRTKTHSVIINLTEQEKERLRAVTKRLGVSMSGFVRLAVFKKLREEIFILKSTKNEVVKDE